MNRWSSVWYMACLFLALGSNPSVGAERLILVVGGDEPNNPTATRAKLQSPFGVAFDHSGNLFMVEMTGHRVLKVSAKGLLTTVAGTGQKGEAGDGGPAKAAQFNGMHSLAVAANGDVY